MMSLTGIEKYRCISERKMGEDPLDTFFSPTDARIQFSCWQGTILYSSRQPSDVTKKLAHMMVWYCRITPWPAASEHQSYNITVILCPYENAATSFAYHYHRALMRRWFQQAAIFFLQQVSPQQPDEVSGISSGIIDEAANSNTGACVVARLLSQSSNMMGCMTQVPYRACKDQLRIYPILAHGKWTGNDNSLWRPVCRALRNINYHQHIILQCAIWCLAP